MTVLRPRARRSRAPRILLLAYSCAPGEGSEPGAGWAFARMLAGIGEVWVLTRENNREAIEAALPDVPEHDRMQFLYVDLPPRLRFWKRGQRGVRLYYLLWLRAALRRARQLEGSVRFDLVWHATLSNGWIGSPAPRLGLPFVYGPIGGGIGTPLRLVPALGVRGTLYELARTAARATGRYLNPLARTGWRGADLILCQNPETLAWLPRRYRGLAHVFPHVALEEPTASPEPLRELVELDGPVALYAGRLLAWKGAALAIRAIAEAPGWRLVVCGRGRDERRLRRLAKRRGVQDRVRFLGALPRQDVLALMENDARVLLHPSMHEDAGWVVAEARARADRRLPRPRRAAAARRDGRARGSRRLAPRGRCRSRRCAAAGRGRAPPARPPLAARASPGRARAARPDRARPCGGVPVTAAARNTLVLAAVAALCASIGVATATHSRLAIAVTLGAGLLGWAIARPFAFWWDVFVFALGGSLLLCYGFANVGIASSTPIPVADLLVFVLFAWASVTKTFRWPTSAPFVVGTLFVSVATARLFFDAPVWGKDALRDYTLAFEVLCLPIGYWAYRTYGRERLIRAMSWIFVACLAYFALYPIADQLAAAGPTVGLQRSVPLLGSYAGATTAAAAGMFFFALVRPFGSVSYLLAAGFIAELAVFQERGIYLAVPGAILVVWSCAGPRVAAGARAGIAMTLATSVVALALLLPLSPQGRLGPVSPWFTVSQLRTLQGHSGPGSGSYEDRIKWFHEVMSEVRAKGTEGWLVGVGLGPDLVRGVSGTDPSIRKPHNDYLEVFARLGIVGFVLFLGLLLTAMLRIVRRARRDEGEDGRLLWWIFAVGLVFLVVAATQPLLAFPYGTIPLFSLLGIGLAICDTRPRPAEAEAEAE